ncbi:MAG TPA: hypothetical protein VE291_06355 [Terracidiphilus sp.]|nr:hypothetical protein [Terracidiphilus sp.]
MDFAARSLSTQESRISALAARSRKTWLGAPSESPVARAIGYNEAWKVFVNVAPEELHGIAGLGERNAVEKKG